MLDNPRRLKWFLSLVLLALTLVAVVTSYLIVERRHTLERVSRYNLTWLLSQAATETLRVVEAASAAAIPGSGVERGDIDVRLDILENRLNIMRSGETEEFLRDRPDLRRVVEDLRAKLTEAQSIAAELPRPGAALRIRAGLEPMVPRLVQLAAAANTRSGALVAEDQRQLSRLHWTLSGLMFAMMACVGGLALLIGRLRERMMRELVAAKEVAETANAAKSQFLANMSHELRTPLNGVLGMLQMIKLGPLQPDQQRYADTAMRSGKMLVGLIASVLDLARIEAQRVELASQPFNLRVLLQDVDEVLGEEARGKGLSFSVKLAPDVPTALIGDLDRLRQVLFNLVGNAVKFTEAGQVSVTVSRATPDAAPGTLRFLVRDTGIGIPAGKLGSIFEPFSQVDMSITRRFGGAGLGLAIAREIVERMGGSLQATSTEGVGSEFSCVLVLQPDPAAAPSTARHAAALATPGAGATEALRVLLVEDDEVSGLVTRSFLEAQGYRVDEAQDGVAALKLLDGATYDVIILDYHMPGLSGAELARIIRVSEEMFGRHTAIIGLSAAASAADRAFCLDAGMDDYLTKPADFDLLLETIHRRVGRSWASASETAAD